MNFKTLLKKSVLLVAGLAAGVNGAWADMTVGTTESNYGTAISGFVTMSKGQSIHYAFTQTTKAEAFFHGFAVAVNKTDGTELAIIRCDNWENKENTNSRFTNTFPSGWGDNATTFQSTIMNGASVDMTITYSAEGAFTMASTITKDGNNYTYNWTRTFDGTPDQVKVSLEADHAQLVISDYPVPTLSVPSTFDFTGIGIHAASPFDKGVWTEGANVQALRFGNEQNPATANFDSNITVDGNQAYSIASNEKVTFTFNTLHGYLGSNLNAVVSIKNSANVTLASYSYNCKDMQINDVKIGGTTVDPFSAFSFYSYESTSNANGLNPGAGKKPYQNDATKNPVITISISGSGAVSLSFTRANGSISQEFVGMLGGSVAKDLAKIVVEDAINNTDRAYCIQQLSIATETVAEANVTYKFVDTSDNDLSSLVADKIAAATIGENIEDVIPASFKNDFLNGDESIKYIYSTYSCSDATVQAGGSTVTLKFAPNTKYTYNVNAKDDEDNSLGTIATVSGYGNEEKTLSWSKYIKVGEQWYSTSTNTFYKTVTAGGSEEVVFTPSNVAYFFEMEKLTRSGGVYLTETNASYSNYSRLRLSRGSLYYTPALAAGVYQLTIGCANTNESNGEVYVYTRSSGGVLSEKLHTHTQAQGSGTLSYVITVPDGYSIAFNGNEGSYNNNCRMDYMTLTQFVPVTIASSGYSSLATDKGLNFAGISGLTAYVVTNITKTAVTLTSVDEIPANQGVILKGTAGATYSIPVKADAAYDGTNKLHAAVTATDIAANQAYILQGGKFCLVTENSTVPAGKAYLLATDVPASEAPALNFIFADSETTGVDATLVNNRVVNNEIFNLSGQRVKTMTKGLYIVGGKKVVVK